MEDADACLISAPAGWSLVPQAHAAAGEARRVVLLRGSGRLRLADRTYPLSEGQEVDLANPSSPRPATEPAWGPRAGWQRVPGLPLRVHDAARELGEAGAAGSGAGFLWEALVRRTQASARFGVIWASGDHHDEGWEVPLGAEVLGTGEGWVRLRLERRRGWVRLTAGALEILSCPEDQSSRRAYPRTPPRSAGILVSGGDVEVLEARWKKVPE